MEGRTTADRPGSSSNGEAVNVMSNDFRPAAWQQAAEALLEHRRRRQELETQEPLLVAAARAAGLHWPDIAYALGLPSSTVYYRYGAKPQRNSKRAKPRLVAVAS
jgi:hypothetical protein